MNSSRTENVVLLIKIKQCSVSLMHETIDLIELSQKRESKRLYLNAITISKKWFYKK